MIPELKKLLHDAFKTKPVEVDLKITSKGKAREYGYLDAFEIIRPIIKHHKGMSIKISWEPNG